MGVAAWILHNIMLLLLLLLCVLSETSAQPFQAGEVGSCEVPTLRGECHDVVDYPVPGPVATTAAFYEARVDREYNNALTTLSNFNSQGLTAQLRVCLEAYRAIHCRIRFPRCQRDQVVLNQQDCSELYRVCPRLSSSTHVITDLGGQLANDLCFGFPNATLPLGDCRPLSELMGSYAPQSCDFDRSMLVTEWMFEIMKHEDRSSNNQCDPHSANFVCSALGQCTVDGRIEQYNTMEQCYAIVDW